jgi:hypothetical protein
MEFHGGTPPAPVAGGIGRHTTSLRPAISLDRDQCKEARRLKRQDPELTAADIAARLGGGATEDAVMLALATLRTKNLRPTRRFIRQGHVGASLAGVAGRNLPEPRRCVRCAPTSSEGPLRDRLRQGLRQDQGHLPEPRCAVRRHRPLRRTDAKPCTQFHRRGRLAARPEPNLASVGAC